jgi:hypothetical protein
VVIPEEYSASTLIESQSTDCGYVPPTPIDGKFKLTLSDSSTVTAACDSTSAITSGEVATQYGGSVVSAEIGDCVTKIGYNAFYNCRYLNSIIIPDSVTTLGDSAFYNSGIKSCIIGSGVTDISYMCFDDTNLSSITIPNNVTSISNDAFENCRSLVYVTIGRGITYIGGWSFQNCPSLLSVTIKATRPPSLGSFVFRYSDKCLIYVPAQSVEAYKTATNWSDYASRIQPIT